VKIRNSTGARPEVELITTSAPMGNMFNANNISNMVRYNVGLKGGQIRNQQCMAIDGHYKL